MAPYSTPHTHAVASCGTSLYSRPAVAASAQQDSPLPELTVRETEVLALLAEGLTAASIGFRLRISTGTVRKHLEHIYQKIGHGDRLLAVTYAQRTGLLPLATSADA